LAPYEQSHPIPVPDGTGGAIVIWDDRRIAPEPEEDITDVYAQRVRSDGTVDAAWPQNGIAVSTAPKDQWNPVLIEDHAGGAIALWEDYRNGASDLYAQRIDFSGVLGAPNVGVVQLFAGGLALSEVWPNPASSGRLGIRFTLPGSSPAWLELLDVMGRRLEAREVGTLGAGEHTVVFPDLGLLAPGVYVVLLRTGSAVRTRQLVVQGP
jgi:hypothetical protein